MTRYLAIDYGTKRIGLALGDDRSRLASPIGMVTAAPDPVAGVTAVLVAVKEYDVDAFVVGLPTNMDGSEGGQAKATRRFGDELQRRSGKPVHYADERLSTFTAQELVQGADLSRRKRRAVEDAIAAQVILQPFLDALPPE